MADSTLAGFLAHRADAREAWARLILAGRGPASAELRGIAAVAVDEIEALRQVLAIHGHEPQSGKRWARGTEQIGCRNCHELDGEIQGIGWCATLRWLAWPYRDQPGYDPAWAPPDRLTSGH